MKQFLKSQSFFLLALGLIAVSAVGVLLYSTPQGLGLSDDSIAYIAGARSLLSGQGYREAWLASNGPVTHFPPGFSSILALIGLSGLDPLRGARFLNSHIIRRKYVFAWPHWLAHDQIANCRSSAGFAVCGQCFVVQCSCSGNERAAVYFL